MSALGFVDEFDDEPKTDIIKALLDSDAPGSNEEAERLMRKKLHCQARRLTPPQMVEMPDPFPESEAPTQPDRPDSKLTSAVPVDRLLLERTKRER